MRTLVTNRLLLLLALTAAVAAARAQAPFPPPPAPTPSGAYAGVTLGSSQAKKDCVGVLEGGGRSCDERDPAFGVFGGYRVNRYLAAELAYRDLGKVRASDATSTEYIHTGVLDLSALGIVPIDQSFFVFGRVGAYNAWQSTSVRGVDDHTNTQLTYGGGVQWDFAGPWSVRAEWQRYKKVGETNGPYGVNYYDVLGVAGIWRFR
jgi:opacity protein-like surface antigen